MGVIHVKYCYATISFKSLHTYHIQYKAQKKLIDDQIENDLYNYIGGICKELECNPVQVGGHKNHIHLLCLLSRKISQMKLVQHVKQGSSKWIKTIDKQYADFYRQDGYGIFSVSPKSVDKVIEYIKKQHNHHKKMSFKDEYRNFLNNYNIDYDERYVWDSIFLACARFGAGGWFDFISHRALHDVVGWGSFGADYNINLELNN